MLAWFIYYTNHAHVHLLNVLLICQITVKNEELKPMLKKTSVLLNLNISIF